MSVCLSVNTSSKTYWKFIKLVYGCKQHSLIPDLEHFGNTISDSSEKATLFNNYFVEQCQTDSDGDNSLPDFTFITESILSSLSINSSHVLKILKGLNTCKAAGHDNINNRILKECALSIYVPLSRLFNLSLSNGVFPTCWKKATLFLFLKKETGIILKIIGQFLYCPLYQKYLKKLYIATFINTANSMTYSLIRTQVLNQMTLP